MKLFIIEPRGSGGMIHYAYQLCTALAEIGTSVTLITSYNYEMESYPHNFIVEKRIRLWDLFDQKSENPPKNQLKIFRRKIAWTTRRILRGFRYIIEWIHLTNYLVKQRPDIIQFGKIEFPFESFFLAWLKRNGIILTQVCHEFELRERKDGYFAHLTNQLYASVYKNFSIIFLHGENCRQRFLSLFSIPSEQTFVIHMGNESLFLTQASTFSSNKDIRQRYRFTSDESIILFFGILQPSKGLPDLLRAFALVYQQNKKTRLIIAGFPSKVINVSELKKLASNLAISDVVTFDTRYIPIEEVGPLMELASVVVYPYRNSTQSASLQVAYTFGRPVVATRVGGLTEVVKDGRSGFLVPPESPNDLAEAVLKIINNPKMAKEMGDYARYLSETHYSWKSIATKIMDAYHDL